VASKPALPLLAAALLGAAAGGTGQQPARVKYTVLDRPAEARVAKPEYRATHQKDSTLVSIFAGRKPTGGYSVVVKGVDRRDGTCTVRYRVEEPAPDAIVTQALTYPAATVRISPACQDAKVDPPLPPAKTK
jgi:hypothetical protein